MSDPLVRLLKQVREAHGLAQTAVEECMGLAYGTYRHIEHGRRALPDFRHGLTNWMQTFENCVDATKEERQTILQALSHSILEQFAGLLKDLEARQ